ncbi:hypothetical protein PUMCH_002811 [Australozyma saopauloensis]|uniref:Aspartyl aminopeptidase n=1 Tax=Australozyma saopauloensis TaxID=291208 RepID=A0AAX4HAX3_9ASCO|nr:hypothetical protein PUMCH_002811 [[Candida] saopauloensis]
MKPLIPPLLRSSHPYGCSRDQALISAILAESPHSTLKLYENQEYNTVRRKMEALYHSKSDIPAENSGPDPKVYLSFNLEDELTTEDEESDCKCEESGLEELNWDQTEGYACPVKNPLSIDVSSVNNLNSNEGNSNGIINDKNQSYDHWCSEYMKFTDTNPTTYHAIATLGEKLKKAGFVPKLEREALAIDKLGGKYYVTRAGKALCAFIVGRDWTPEDGIAVVGAHVDALTAKLKPNSTKKDVKGYSLLGVAPYSGALNLLWLDRDLGIAGSVLIRSEDGLIRSVLVSSGRHAVCRIPSLAPHFGANSVPPYNKETQMVPVLGYGETEPATPDECKAPLYGKHSIALLRYVSELAKCQINDLILVDLELFDVQPACRGGLTNDFMYAPRIDDRLCSFSAVEALIETLASFPSKLSKSFSVVLLADNEEIGSASRTGAKGKLLNSIVERVICERGLGRENVPLAFANSLILSADVTHALNPNFLGDYLENHAPLPNTGLTLKIDANGHVMTDLTGLVVMEKIAGMHGLSLQKFHIRNDHPSGGTIGPMLAVDTGSRVVDVGLAQLSMHSIRASCGYKEAGIGVETFAAFFASWRQAMDLVGY